MHCIYEITHTIYHITHMTTQKIHLPSHPLYLTLHPGYLFHQTRCINCILPTICMTLHTLCMTSHSVCMTSHEHFMTSHPYRYDITSVYFWHHIQYIWYRPCCFHENTVTILDISPTIFDIRVYLCCHKWSIDAITIVMVVITLATRMTS